MISNTFIKLNNNNNKNTFITTQMTYQYLQQQSNKTINNINKTLEYNN